MMRLCCISSLALLLSSSVQGGRMGALNCRGGESAPQGPHRPAVIDSTLEQGGFVITIDDTPLVVGEPLSLLTGSSYNVTIAKTADAESPFFQGVMARISGGDANVDASDIMTPIADDGLLQPNIYCDDEPISVSGVTHTSDDDKTSVSFEIILVDASDNMLIDVSIVQTLSPSIIYWTQYSINAVDPPAPTATPTTGAPTFPMPTAAPTEQRTIYGIANGANLTIATLVDAAGLVDELDNPLANLTLLMPSESILAALPTRMATYLVENGLLANLLSGHVLPLEAPASFVATLDGQDVTFLNNVSQTVTVAADGTITITATEEKYGGQAMVIGPDAYLASNGVIHEIDRILGLPTLTELIAADATALVLAISTAGLVEEFATMTGVTFFAPTFDGLQTLTTLFPTLASVVTTDTSWSAHMSGLLLAHVVDDVIMAEDLEDGDVITARTGHNFTVSVANGTGVSLSPGSIETMAVVETRTTAGFLGFDGMAPVIQPNILTAQGVIHSIDAVLLPSWLFQTIVDVAKTATPTLANLVELAGLGDDLLALGITVFAPTEDAFASLDQDVRDFLTSDEGRSTLIQTLQYHVLPSLLPAVNVMAGSVSSALGPAIQMSVSGGVVFLNEDAKVAQTDVLANNGIVHLIDKGLEVPPSAPPTLAPTAMPTTTTAPETTRGNSAACPLSVGIVGSVLAVLALVV